MLARARRDAFRVRALVAALEQHEITLDEVSDVVGSLTPEAMQVTALLIGEWTGDGTATASLFAAHQLCSRLASQARVLS
jgi:hypothetical protein